MPTVKKHKEWVSPSIGYAFITLLGNLTAIGMTTPVLPSLFVEHAQGSPSRGAQLFGINAALYSSYEFFLSPVWGSASDQFGRRRFLLVSLIGLAIEELTLTMASSLWMLFAAHVASGSTNICISTTYAIIADSTTPAERGRKFGLVGLAFGLGFSIGPVAGGILSLYGKKLPLLAACLLSCTNAIYTAMFVPESLSPTFRSEFRLSRANPIGALSLLRSKRSLSTLALVLFFTTLAFMCMQSVWILYTTYKFHWTLLNNGILMGVFGLLFAVSQGGIVRYAVPRFGERRTMLAGGVIGLIAFLWGAFMDSETHIFIFVMIASVSTVLTPATIGLMSKSVRTLEQGRLQGAVAVLNTMARILAPLLGTNLFAYFTEPTAPVIFPGAVFLVGAVFQATAIVILVKQFDALQTAEWHSYDDEEAQNEMDVMTLLETSERHKPIEDDDQDLVILTTQELADRMEAAAMRSSPRSNHSQTSQEEQQTFSLASVGGRPNIAMWQPVARSKGDGRAYRL